MGRNKYQGSVLFEDSDAPLPISPVESPQDEVQDFMSRQGELLSKVLEIRKEIEENDKQLKGYIQTFTDMQNLQGETAEKIANMEIYMKISNRSQEDISRIIGEKLNSFQTEIHKATDAEIERLRTVTRNEESNIDVVRLRWWPHGYILIAVFCVMFCIIVKLFLYYIRH